MSNCKIQKNKDGKIVQVLDASNKPSALFKEILNVPTLALNEAIDIYKNVYSDKLKDKVRFQKSAKQNSIEVAIQRNNGNPLNLAPNGKPSVLYQSYKDLGYSNIEAERLVAQVYSNKFISWFGDWLNDSQNTSKVVDENGQPMLTWHNSKNNFNEFRKTRGKRTSLAGVEEVESSGFFFAKDKEFANAYGDIAYPSFLNIRNVFDISQGDGKQQDLYKKVTGRDMISDMPFGIEHAWEYFDGDEFDISDSVIKNNFDGVNIYEKSPENSNLYSDVFIVFNPNQIKSATENVGTFSTENNDIRFSLGEEKTAGEINQELIDRLKQNGLSEDVFLMSTEEIEAKLKELNEKDVKNIPNGFVYNNQVFLNKDTADDSTLLHEYNHLFTSWLKENRKELYNKGIDLVKKEIFDKSKVLKSSDVATGKKVEIFFNKNTEKAPNFGSIFGQDVEPSGNYITQKESDMMLPNYKQGVVTFNNPLVIDVNDETIISYKNELSKKYNNLTGKKLTEALKKEGYDGIITTNGKYLGEIIAFDNSSQIYSDISEIISYVKTTQPTLTGEALYEEILTEVVSRYSGQLMDEQKIKSPLMQWLSDFWKTIADLFNIFELSPSQVANLTLKKFSEYSASALINNDIVLEKLIELNIIERLC